MADVTVTQFAEALKVPVERLLTQLDEAGIAVKSETDTISDAAKLELLSHLRKSHGRSEVGRARHAAQDRTKTQITERAKLSGMQGRAKPSTLKCAASGFT